eukprot:2864114-Alexandrium_andersonii.AAC.1
MVGVIAAAVTSLVTPCENEWVARRPRAPLSERLRALRHVASLAVSRPCAFALTDIATDRAFGLWSIFAETGSMFAAGRNLPRRAWDWGGWSGGGCVNRLSAFGGHGMVQRHRGCSQK